MGIDPEKLDDVLASCHGWPGIDQARVAIAFAEARCESPLELWVRIWLRTGGLPVPTPQYTVRVGRRHVGRVDFCFEAERVVVECDGQIKYRPGSSWTATPSETLWKEKLREDEVRAAGFEVVRAYAKDGKDGGTDLCRRVLRAMDRAGRR